MRKNKAFHLFLVAAILGGTIFLFAHAEAYNASDVIGQLNADDTPNYTKALSFNDPNARGFNIPISVAIDTQRHRLFVAEYGNNRIVVYNLDSNNNISSRVQSNVIGQPDLNSYAAATSQTGLHNPWDLAIDVSGGRLFAADQANNRVLVFDVTSVSNGMSASNVIGQINFTSSTATSSQTGLNTPTAVAYDSVNNRLWIGDQANNRVLAYNAASISNGMSASFVLGQTNFTNRSTGNSSSTMNSPIGFGLDTATDRLFVADSVNNRVTVFNVASGTLVNTKPASFVLGQMAFGVSTASTSATGMSDPIGLAYDPTNNRLFVSEYNNRRITFFNVASGSVSNGQAAVNVLGQSGFTTNTAGNGQNGVNGTYHIALDSTNQLLYVPEGNTNGGQPNHRVSIWNVASGTIANGENASDGLGALDVSDNPVWSKGRFLTDNAPDSGRGISFPAGVVVDTTHHRLFVDDANGYRILVFPLDSSNNLSSHVATNVIGALTLSSLGPASTTQQYFAASPYGVEYDSVNDRLFVSDSANNRVLVFNTATITNGMNASYVLGQPVFTSATSSTSQSGMKNPRTISYDSVNNRLFVADGDNNRVLIYDVNPATITNGENASYVLGQTVFTTATSTTSQSGMNLPWGVTYNSTTSYLMVADLSNNRVLFFNTDPAIISNGMNASYVLGQPTFASSSSHTTQSGFNAPVTAMWDNDSNQIYVSDYANSRVMVFDGSQLANGMNAVFVLGQINFTSSTAAATQGNLNLVHAPLGFDPGNKRLYVGEQQNHRVSIFNFVHITLNSLNSGTVGSSYSQAITSSGSQGTLSFSVSSGTLPSGLNLSSDGTISGTPNIDYDGLYTFTVKASDNNGNAGTISDLKTYSLLINQPVRTASTGGGSVTVSSSAPPVTSTNSGTNSGNSTTTSVSGSSTSTTPTTETLFGQLISLIRLAETKGLQLPPSFTALLGNNSGALENFIFTHDMYPGMHHPDAKELQIFLNSHGFTVAESGPGSTGHETEYMGKATAAALRKFQEAHAADILLPNGFSHGTGILGPSTRAFINKGN